MRYFLSLFLAAVVVPVGPVGPAWAQSVHYAMTVQGAWGDYIFAERTTTLGWGHDLRVQGERWQLGVNVPVLVQTTPWISAAGVGPIPSGGPQSGRVGRRVDGGGGMGNGGSDRGMKRHGPPVALPDTADVREVGVGDPQVRVGLRLRDGASPGPGLDATAIVKPPLADVDRGFGTGAWDAGLGLSAAQRLGPWLLTADAAAWRLGDLDSLALNDVLAYGASVGRVLPQAKVGLMASVSGTTRPVDGIPAPVSVGASVLWQPTPVWGLNASAHWGLTDGAPDAAVSLGLSVRLRRDERTVYSNGRLGRGEKRFRAKRTPRVRASNRDL